MENKKEIQLNDMYEVDKLLSKAEEILRWTRFEDEGLLINHLRSYLALKRQKLQ